MYFFHSLGISHRKVVIAAVELLPAKVLAGQVLRSQVGAHGTVHDQHAFLHGCQIR